MGKRNIIIFFQITLLYLLQNMCSYLIIPNYNLIKQEFYVSDTLLGMMSGLYLFFNGIAAIFWSYLSDVSLLKRKIFLSLSMFASGIFSILAYMSPDFINLLIWRVLTGISLGSVLPLGFSILSDAFRRERRTQIFMIWYVLSGFGLGIGFGMAVILGNYFNWRLPLLYGGLTIILLGGFVSLVLLEPARASSEDELKDLLSSGIEYKYRFSPGDLAILISNRSNFFAALQGILGTIPNGIIFTWSLQYLVRDVGASELVASIFLGFMSVGALGGLIISYIADKLYQIHVAMRPIIAGFCSIIESILFILFFSLPLKINVYTKDIAEALQEVFKIITSDFTFIVAFFLFFMAMFFNSSVGPIRNSVISDVNLPEHRATVLAGVTILELFSKAIGIAVVGFLADFLGSLRFSIIIAMVFWIFSGIAWFYLAWYYEYDINFIRGVLTSRRKSMEKNNNLKGN
ncbi:MAG: MFS transporter [Candidatus Odinarchaeota archaeon]|nr:MFS transporter [Candidatus Odinarchaeota archaeon]